MGRRGPPPKPSALKKLEGTFRPDRAAPREVSPPPGVPDAPEWLDEEARAEWERIVPHLAKLRILAEIDRGTLADYCTAHSLAVASTVEYQREGLMVDTPHGPRKHPLIKVAQEARAQARVLAQEFGLSPSSRTRISAPPKPAEGDNTEDFLFGGPRLVKGGGNAP